MREIKFRGKMVGKNGINDWVFGHIQPVFTGMCIMQVCKYKTSSGIELFQIDENTVGQYTGLKDDDGIEVYEGDVVSVVPIKRSLYIGVVKFHPHTASFVLQAAQDPKAWFSLHDDFAIAIHGNIYDDEDLKKKYWEIYQK